jgi:dienelactone hydrolase
LVKRHRHLRAGRGSVAVMTLSADIADFRRRDMTFAGKTRTVLVTGAIGPAIVVMHEIYGFTPTLARFCRWVRHAGFRIYAPILLGTPDAANPETVTLGRTIGLCISREFTMLAANKSSPITDWLKALARQAHTECGGPGVGAIGMCLTGGFALSMAVDPVIMAPVLSQPGLPAMNHAALDISPAELAQVKARTTSDGLSVRGYRFEGDTLSRAERFVTLCRELGDAFIGSELPDACGNPAGLKARGKPPHSVFTGDLIDAAGELTRQAVDEVIAFFRERLVPAGR